MNIMNLVTELFVLFLLFTEGWSRNKNITRDNKKCFGLPGCGYTVPDGDIILEYGEPLNITCNLYEGVAKNWSSQNTGLPSSRLYFRRNERSLYPNTEYDPNNKTAERVEILNETSIRLTIERPEKTLRDNLFCYFNKSIEKKGQMPACNNMIVVGTPPQKVTDFSCISENFENLTCTWNIPQNFVLTEYKLFFYFPMFNKLLFKCPDSPMYDRDYKIRYMQCKWTLFTEPQYRQSKRIYIFALHINNSLGNLTQEFQFDHYKNMRPKPVEHLDAKATSPHSIQLMWGYNSKFEGFPEDLVGKILYKCEYCNQSWHIGGFIEKAIKVKTYNLTDLQYAHALYDIRVSIKPKEAGEDMWSDNASITMRTKSDKPECPPKVTLGSFQMVNTINSQSSRDVYVYFQEIEESQKNGQKFSYEVESIPYLRPTEITKTYAKFERLDDREYIIRIWSKNEIGRSDLSSHVVIPATPLNEPEQFFKIERSTDIYELEWEIPKGNQSITSYTLFWCSNERDRPHQCVGYLDWIVLSNTTTRYNITLHNHTIYQFAVTANSNNSSSGMRWAECTVLANKTVGKIRNVWVNLVGADFIELTWKLDCSDILSQVVGYVISYCNSNTLSKTNVCEGELKNITIDGNLSVQSARVPNLTPYTTYLLAVSVKSINAMSQRSEWLRNVTSECAPSTPPLNIIITQVTNSSITLEWSPPEISNGAIKGYNIIYNGVKKVIDAKKTNETITDLESYKKYTISMQACTVSCSNSSTNQTVVTKMGTPAKIGRPCLIESVDGSNVVGWDKPDPPRGELNYYQLSLTPDGMNMDNGEMTNFSNAENYTVKNCNEETLHSIYVSLRAVNIIDGEHFHGPWSDTMKISCYHSTWYFFVYIVLAAIAFIIMIIGFRKLYIYWNIARHIEIKLPPGLAPAVEHSEKNSDIVSRSFSQDPDVELLLERKAEKCLAGDSSGCSSGQESITSSVESTTHLSMDSGTDQPRNVTDDNKENSLRPRNVSNKGYVMHDPTPVINRVTKPSQTPAGNYCLIGVDPSTKSIQDSPYLTISDLEHTLSPYVSSDYPANAAPPSYIMTDIFKTPNPGYVPFSPKEPASKNTGYVVAGDLTSTPTTDVDTDYMVIDTQMRFKPATVWQQPPTEPSLTKPGYVSVGDALPPLSVKEGKGYVPHRQFKKTLKEE